MKIKSLLKAVLSQDMNLFKISVNNDASKLKKMILPVVLFIVVLYAMGTYAFMMAQILAPAQMIHVMLTLFIIVCTVISFVEGIYKSQGMLFDAKDNDLLLSLPIKKSHILFVRLTKLLIFQYLFNLMFLLPAVIVYAYYMTPDISFYIISVIMSLLVPIIPTVCGSIIGYMIKLLSSKFKKKGLVQTILSIIITVLILLLSMNINTFINELATNANGINEAITKLYYPIELYLNLIDRFNILDFASLIVINLMPLGIFILIGAKYYYKIITKTVEGNVNSANGIKKGKIAHKKPLKALTLKEIKRYFSSPVCIINTLFGPVIIFLTTILLCVKGTGILNVEGMPISLDIEKYLPAIYYALVVAICSLTQITAFSISIEGRTINITKSLPVSWKTICDSKILMSLIIELPLILISNLLFIIKFRVNLIYSLLILGITFSAAFLMSVLGLIINLKYPKMDANNDTEIVKQSISVLVAVILGMLFISISTGAVIYLSRHLGFEMAIICHLILVTILGLISYSFLCKKGKSAYTKINV